MGKVISGITGALGMTADPDAGAGAMGASMGATRQALEELKKVKPSDYRKIEEYIRSAASIVPELQGVIEAEELDLDGILGALERPEIQKAIEANEELAAGYEDIIEAGGRDAQLEAEFDKEMDAMAASEQAGRKAVERKTMEQGGEVSSGTKFQLSQANAQANAQRKQDLAMQKAARMQGNKMQAAQNLANLRGQARQQAGQEAANEATSRQVASQFGAMNRMNAQQQNLAAQQNLANLRSAQQRQMYGQLGGLESQKFNEAMARAGGVASGYQNLAGMYGQEAQRQATAAQQQAAGNRALFGTALMAGATMMGGPAAGMGAKAAMGAADGGIKYANGGVNYSGGSSYLEQIRARANEINYNEMTPEQREAYVNKALEQDERLMDSKGDDYIKQGIQKVQEQEADIRNHGTGAAGEVQDVKAQVPEPAEEGFSIDKGKLSKGLMSVGKSLVDSAKGQEKNQGMQQYKPINLANVMQGRSDASYMAMADGGVAVRRPDEILNDIAMELGVGEGYQNGGISPAIDTEEERAVFDEEAVASRNVSPEPQGREFGYAGREILEQTLDRNPDNYEKLSNMMEEYGEAYGCGGVKDKYEEGGVDYSDDRLRTLHEMRNQYLAKMQENDELGDYRANAPIKEKLQPIEAEMIKNVEMGLSYAEGGMPMEQAPMEGMNYEAGGEGTIIDSKMESYQGDMLPDRINDREMVLNVEQQDRLNDRLIELKRLKSKERTDKMLADGTAEVNPEQQEALMAFVRGEIDVDELPNDRVVKEPTIGEPTGGMAELLSRLQRKRRG